MPQDSEPAAPRRSDHMTGNPGRQRARGQPRRDIGDSIRIIEDQQPPRHAAQLIADLIAQRIRIGGRLQAQPGRQGRELTVDQRRLFGRDPPHQVIVTGMGVGVLGGQLGLADPAQTAHRMHRHRPRGQDPRQLAQFRAAASEMGVARGHLPHPRQQRGEPRLARHRPARARKTRRHSGLGPPGQRAGNHCPQPDLRIRLS